MRQTHVEKFSQSDNTNISKALCVNSTNLVACQASHVLPSLSYFGGVVGGPFFSNFFGLEVEMSFYACTRDGHQSRSRRFEATHFFEGFNARSLGGSAVNPIKVESLVVSDHNTNLLQTSSSFLTSIYCQLCFPELAPSPSMSAECELLVELFFGLVLQASSVGDD